MMKRIFFLTVIFSLSLLFSNNLSAQFAEKIAYINSEEILDSIPERINAAKSIEELNQKYKDELGIMQADYKKKYSDFMTYQESMTESIKLRRMQELYELEKNISQFMKVAQEDIEAQEQLKIEPLRQKVQDAINQVGMENDFICIYDLANPSIVFVTPKAVDATSLVKEKLGIKRKR